MTDKVVFYKTKSLASYNMEGFLKENNIDYLTIFSEGESTIHAKNSVYPYKEKDFSDFKNMLLEQPELYRVQ